MHAIRGTGGIAALAVTAALACAGAASAGYTWPDKTKNPVVGGRTPIGYGPNTQNIGATTNALIAGGYAADAQTASAKLDELQDAAKTAIDLVRLQDADLGSTLWTLLRLGQIDADFTLPADSVI